MVSLAAASLDLAQVSVTERLVLQASRAILLSRQDPTPTSDLLQQSSRQSSLDSNLLFASPSTTATTPLASSSSDLSSILVDTLNSLSPGWFQQTASTPTMHHSTPHSDSTTTTPSPSAHDLQQLLESMIHLPPQNDSNAPTNPSDSTGLATERNPSSGQQDDGYTTTTDPDDLFLGLTNFDFDPSVKPASDQAAINVAGLTSSPHQPRIEDLSLEMGLSPTTPAPFSSFPFCFPPTTTTNDPVALLAALSQVSAAGPGVQPMVQSTAPSPTTTWDKAHSSTDSSDSTSIRRKRRRARQASELIDVDAPIKKRTYWGPSQTSRKDYGRTSDHDDAHQDRQPEAPIPTATATTPSGTGTEPGTEIEKEPASCSEDTALAALLEKRHKNTISARQCRRRKAQELQVLQAENERLVASNQSLTDELAQTRQALATFQDRFALLLPGL